MIRKVLSLGHEGGSAEGPRSRAWTWDSCSCFGFLGSKVQQPVRNHGDTTVLLEGQRVSQTSTNQGIESPRLQLGVESPRVQLSMERKQQTLIVDVGHFFTRIGWSHEDKPRVTMNTGRCSVRDLIDKHLDDLGGWPFDNTLVCVTEGTWNRSNTQIRNERNRMARELTLDDGPGRFAGLHIANTAAMQLLASGRRSGLVVDIGQSLRVTPVYESAAVEHAFREMPHPTHDECVDFILRVLPALSGDNNPRQRAEEVRPHCSVALHYKKEHQAAKHGPHEDVKVHGCALRRASVVTHCERHASAIPITGTTQLAVPELYFQPDLMRRYVCGSNHEAETRLEGLPEVVVDAVMSIEPHLRNLMFTNILIAGRGALFPGFDDRLKMELAKILPAIYDIEVVCAESHQNNLSAYLGTQQFVQTPDFHTACISGKDAVARYIEMVSEVF